MKQYNINELTDYLLEKDICRTFEAYELASIYVETQHEVTEKNFEDFLAWVQERDDNAQKVYADTSAEFAESIWLETADEYRREILEELSPFINWELVWNSGLRHDWHHWTNPDTGESFFISQF